MPFLTPLDVRKLEGGQRRYQLLAPLGYQRPDGIIIWADAGFVTDFASVPRGLWNILPPDGSYAPAAVIHDYLYQNGGYYDVDLLGWRQISRRFADETLRHGAKDIGTSRAVRWLIWAALRVGGWGVWRRYRNKDLTTILHTGV